MITKSKLEEFIDLFLEDNSFDDLLEFLDISTYEALECLFADGLVDEDQIDEYIKR